MPSTETSWSIDLRNGHHIYEGFLYFVRNGKSYSIRSASDDTLKSCCQSKGYQFNTYNYDRQAPSSKRYYLKCANSESCLGSDSRTDQRIWLQCLPICDEGFYLKRDIPKCLACPQGLTSQKNSEKCNC